MRTARRALVVAFALVAVVIVGCSSAPPEPTPTPTTGDGSSTHEVQAADGHAVSLQLWRVDVERVAIYLHEYREEQSAWWPVATTTRRLPVSAITFDFRGHGATEGDPDDVPGMIEDARAVVAFARAEGFRQIMLVGAGMGAAIAIEIAAEQPDLHVIGLSTPSEFDLIDARVAMPDLTGRVALAATEEDLSAAHSLGELRDAGQLPETYARVYPGRAHGVDMLREVQGEPPVALEFMNELMATFWAPPAGALR